MFILPQFSDAAPSMSWYLAPKPIGSLFANKDWQSEWMFRRTCSQEITRDVTTDVLFLVLPLATTCHEQGKDSLEGSHSYIALRSIHVPQLALATGQHHTARVSTPFHA